MKPPFPSRPCYLCVGREAVQWGFPWGSLLEVFSQDFRISKKCIFLLKEEFSCLQSLKTSQEKCSVLSVTLACDRVLANPVSGITKRELSPPPHLSLYQRELHLSNGRECLKTNSFKKTNKGTEINK